MDQDLEIDAEHRITIVKTNQISPTLESLETDVKEVRGILSLGINSCV